MAVIFVADVDDGYAAAAAVVVAGIVADDDGYVDGIVVVDVVDDSLNAKNFVRRDFAAEVASY
jgi:hypothetical protein